jgi:hypothetical protein
MSEEEEAPAAPSRSRGESGIDRDRAKFRCARRSRLSYPRVWVALCCLVALGAMFAPASGQSLRVIEGRAVGSNDQPLQNAIVYLQDQKTMEVKTYITEADGKFRFGQLSSDVDYQVWAKYQNRKSKTKSISSFDSKTQFDFDLKVDSGK